MASDTEGILKAKIPLTSDYMCTHYYTYKHRYELQKAVQPATA